jgi:large repetitive protein
VSLVSSIARHKRGVASAIAIGAVAAVPIVFAIMHQGFPVTDVTLDAKDVWVTNSHSLQGGRLNRQIEELDGAVSGQASDLDVAQSGNRVVLFDPSRGELSRIDPAYTELVEPAKMPAGSQVALGGTTLAITAGDGRLWVVDVANGLTFDPSQQPTLKLGDGGRAVVTDSGAVVAISAKNQLLFRIDSPGATAVQRGIAVPKDAQLAAAGDRAVIFAPGSRSLERDDGSTIPLPAAAEQLQLTGDGDEVALATGSGLLLAQLGSGEVRSVPADLARSVSDPTQITRPVVVAGCAHGAWAGAQRYLLACDGQKPKAEDIDQQTQGNRLVFRVNDDVVALNDMDTGNVWLLDDQMRLVNNWQQVTPPQQDDTEDGHQKASTQSFQDTLAERTQVNRPPIARDDNYGVRPGRTTVLPVLDNDTDPDGDVLTIPKFTGVPDTTGTIDVIDSGRALQFTPATGATAASFRYTVDDGRGGIAEASVTVRIVPETENTAPVAVRQTAISVESGGTISYNVLADWRDPDGDDIYLDAATPTSADQVRFTPDGFITFQSLGGETGAKNVQFTVSDGKLTTTGTLEVDVQPAGKLGPVGTPDFATAFRGKQVEISPLANDVAPDGGALGLLGVSETPSGATVTPNLQKGTVTFASSTVGTYYFKYQLAAGAASSVGLVRVDVLPDPTQPQPPIAVKDTAFLRAGQPTTVKVLQNDVSPDGKVLAVQSVDTSQTDPGVSVEVLSNAVIRISTSSALATQTQFRYTVSDGSQTSTAGVTIVPVPPIVNRQPPVAVDDKVLVRAGDIVSADVLANDFHPDQAQLILEPDLVDTTDKGDGALVFVGDGKVRYQAPGTPGEHSVVYRVTDQYGETATARVSFVVTAPDAKTDQDPAPGPLVARVFAGAKVPITVPLDGVDPDGDSVVIDGIQSPPQLGTITASSTTGFEYQANDAAAGTDTFTYTVEDPYGRKGIGTIEIGVIPRPDTAAPPNAVDDAVTMKPGRTATVQPLLNDSDPSGYGLTLTGISDVDRHLEATVDHARIIVVAPKTEGTYALRYAITNNHGGEDTAFVQVKVTADAPPVYPTAQDVVVPATSMVGKSSVPVKLAASIANPAGLDGDLKVSLGGVNANLGSVDQASQTVTVTPGDTRAAIAYTVTNPDDGLTASAFIIVPPKQTGQTVPPPYLNDRVLPQYVDMNATKTWKLADILVVPAKTPPKLIDAGDIQAPNSDGSPIAVGDDAITYTPAKDFRGQTTLTFKVTDGTSADDPNGHTALISFPITVGDPDQLDQPPSFAALDLEVQPGEAPQTRDLRDATQHPSPKIDKSQFSYSGLTGDTADIHATLGGSQLGVSAELGTQPGTTATLHVTIRYRDFTVPATIHVKVVSSNRPRTQANEDDAKGQRGKSDTIDVLANDTNPFPDKPLTLTDAQIENAAQSGATISFTKDGKVTVKPNTTFIGVVSVIYTVQDATKDPSRNVTGRLQYTVRDVPGKPAAPTFVEGDRTVTVQWQAPATNGEPITGYTITGGPSGAVHVDGDVATKVFSGLTNGNSYTFYVQATNAVGDGAISDASGTAKPFGTPSAPGSASISASTNGDGTLTLDWGSSNGNGRNISGYDITMNGVVTHVGNVVHTTLPGHVGTSYSFTVVAINDGGLKSTSSPQSNSAVPKPSAPTISASQSGSTAVFTYGAAKSTDPVTYTLSGNASGTVSAPGTTNVPGSYGSSYSVTITATSNGQTTSATASVTLKDPYTIALCYGGKDPVHGWNYLGVRWSGNETGNHHIDFDVGTSTVDFSDAAGTKVSGAYHARGGNDDNATITWTDNGVSHSTRWGDAPAC